MAVDPVGAPLLDLVTISLKDGYRNVHAMALLDQPKRKKENKHKHELLKWIDEITEQHEAAGSAFWLCIHKRLGRAGVVYMPYSLYRLLPPKAPRPGYSYMKEHPLAPSIGFYTKNKTMFMVVTLERFLSCVTPEMIKQILRRY